MPKSKLSVQLLVQENGTDRLPTVYVALVRNVFKSLTWSLDYGDGTRESGAQVVPATFSHQYGAGTFVATLRVQDKMTATYAQATVTTGRPVVAHA